MSSGSSNDRLRRSNRVSAEPCLNRSLDAFRDVLYAFQISMIDSAEPCLNRSLDAFRDVLYVFQISMIDSAEPCLNRSLDAFRDVLLLSTRNNRQLNLILV